MHDSEPASLSCISRSPARPPPVPARVFLRDSKPVSLTLHDSEQDCWFQDRTAFAALAHSAIIQAQRNQKGIDFPEPPDVDF